MEDGLKEINDLRYFWQWHAISIIDWSGGYEMTSADVKTLTQKLFDSRRTGQTNPEGHFQEPSGFWYPSGREAHGTFDAVKKPTRSWPHSYLIHCRSKKHCRTLVQAALALKEVPPDVLDIVTRPDPAEAKKVKAERSKMEAALPFTKEELAAMIREAIAEARA